jgi:hypothetical protein
MIKLKEILQGNDNPELAQYLKDFKSKNPNATTDEISDTIISYFQSKGQLMESTAKELAKLILPALVLVYGITNADSISKNVVNKVEKSHISQVASKSVKNAPSQEQMMKWVEKYSKKYHINSKNLVRLMGKESGFLIKKKSYNPFVVADQGNELGPSYGAAQIKVVTAKELYELEPESDVNPSHITSKKLQYDVEFNIRTSAKLLARYYYNKFQDVKNPRQRMAFAATAYNAGYTGAKKYGINTYGKHIGGIM